MKAAHLEPTMLSSLFRIKEKLFDRRMVNPQLIMIG